VADDILVSVAGPLSNIILVFIFGTILKVYLMTKGAGAPSAAAEPLVILLFVSVEINVILAIFNMIPVPPLDGSHVIRHFLRGSALDTYDRIGTYGLMLLFIANWYFNFLGFLFRPAYALVDRIFLS
jgi:Zn-dependent protease